MTVPASRDTTAVRAALGSRTPRPTPAERCVCRPGHVPLQERQIIALVAESVPVEDIAAQLHYSVDTVNTYLARARRRLGARNRMHLVTLAFRDRLIGFDKAGRVVVASSGAA